MLFYSPIFYICSFSVGDVEVLSCHSSRVASSEMNSGHSPYEVSNVFPVSMWVSSGISGFQKPVGAFETSRWYGWYKGGMPNVYRSLPCEELVPPFEGVSPPHTFKYPVNAMQPCLG